MDHAEKSKHQPKKATQEKEEGTGKSGLNTLFDTMTLVNRSYVYEFASDAYCRDHGRSKKEVVGSPMATIWGEANFNKYIKKHIDQCFAGNVVRYENWLEFPGEEPRFYRVSYSPYFNSAGQVTHAVVASQDITDLKTEEEALMKSEPAFRRILKNMHYGVFTFDTEGRFTFVNDVLIKRSGYPRKWYAGKNLFDVVRPQEREMVRQHFEATVRGEHVPPYRFPFRKATDDAAWAYISTTPLREVGRIVGVLGIILDVTKQTKAEQALRESEEKYRRLFEDSRDAIFITDAGGKLTEVNPAFLKLLGYTKEEAQELHAIDTYVNREDCKTYVETIKEQGFVDFLEVKLKKKQGAVMNCLLNGTPFRTDDGAILGYQGIIRYEPSQRVG
jgi:PAS domain S-box-containing protein